VISLEVLRIDNYRQERGEPITSRRPNGLLALRAGESLPSFKLLLEQEAKLKKYEEDHKKK
jgi:hypothetical protein